MGRISFFSLLHGVICLGDIGDDELGWMVYDDDGI